MEVRGDVRLIEAGAISSFVRERLLGPARFISLVLWLLVGAAVFLVAEAYRYVLTISPGLAPYAAVGTAVALTLAFRANARLYHRLYRSALKTRGLLDPNPTVFRIEDDALVCETPHYFHRLAWAGISEISRDDRYWVFFAGGVNYFAPTRLFKSVDEEREFIDRCRRKLSAQALARCRD
jgi:hypothetical protein